ncbi:MAG: YCF48-related protein [Chloroflexota bacterium]
MKNLSLLTAIILIGFQPLFSAWQKNNINIDGGFRAYQVMDNNKIFMLSDLGQIIKINKNDDKWDSTLTDYSPEKYYTGFFFIDSLNGWVVGNLGNCLKTTNGGATWTKNNSSALGKELLTNIQFKSKTEGYITSNNKVFSTSNAGETWEKIYENKKHSYYGSKLIDTCLFLIDDGGNLTLTSNNGTSWDTLKLSETELTSISYSNGEIWISSYDNKLHKSKDLGRNWETMDLNIKDRYILDIFFINKNTGWLTTGENEIFKSTDGGITWKLQLNGIPNPYSQFEPIFFVYFFDELRGIAGSANSKMYETFNGGDSVTSVTEIADINCKVWYSKGNLYFNINDDLHINNLSIMDVAGKELKSFDFNNQAEMKEYVMPFSINPGIYIIRIGANDKNIYKKLIID